MTRLLLRSDLLFFSAAAFLGGMLVIFTSRRPQTNSITRVIFRLWTLAPRVGSMTDETWVLLNGIGGVFVGVLFFVLYFAYPS